MSRVFLIHFRKLLLGNSKNDLCKGPYKTNFPSKSSLSENSYSIKRVGIQSTRYYSPPAIVKFLNHCKALNIKYKNSVRPLTIRHCNNIPI